MDVYGVSDTTRQNINWSIAALFWLALIIETTKKHYELMTLTTLLSFSNWSIVRGFHGSCQASCSAEKKSCVSGSNPVGIKLCSGRPPCLVWKPRIQRISLIHVHPSCEKWLIAIWKKVKIPTAPCSPQDVRNRTQPPASNTQQRTITGRGETRS